MALKKGFWKLALGIAGWVSIIGCLAATTFSWFAVSNSVTPSGTASTKAVSTTAKVYQNNAHDNDDPYSKEPTSDSGGTLSYDHSKGGRAVDFFIEMGSKTLQMFENVNNSGDQAAYFNIKFSSAWQIKSASGTVYGYSQLLSGCPSYGDFSNSAGKLSAGSGFYDIYLNSDTPTAHIWITPHYEVTVSDEMGEHTGYYIIGDSDDPNSSFYGCDNQVDEEHAKAMYVNAAKQTTDKAFYTGLRLASGDTISVISGDTLAKYETPEPEQDPEHPTNLLNIDSYFTGSSGVFTCHSLGYYSVALNENSRLFISEWDGYEVDGTTSYVARDDGDNILNAHPTGTSSGIGRPNPKRAVQVDTQSNLVQSGFSSYNIEVNFSGNNDNAYWQIWNGSTNVEVWNSGTNWTNTNVANWSSWADTIYIKRCNPSNHGQTWNEWAVSDYKTKNWITINGWSSYRVQTKSVLTIAYVDAAGTTIKNSDSIVCWNKDSIVSSDGWSSKCQPDISGYTFDDYYTTSTGATKATTDAYISANATIYARYKASYRVSFSSYKMDTGTVTANVVSAKDVLQGGTFIYPSLPSTPAHYKLYNDAAVWHDTTETSSSTHAPGATSSAVNAPKTYFVLYEKLPSCTVTYKEVVDGVVNNTPIATDSSFYQGEAKYLRASPGPKVGYNLINGWCNASNSGSAAYSFGASYTPNSATKTFYAIYTSKTFNYYLTGSAKGNWGTGSGSILQTAAHSATSITWSSVSFDAGEQWKIHRPVQNPEFANDDWWGNSTMSANSYFAAIGNDNNIQAKYAGTFNITLTLSNGNISITRVNLDATNFPLYKDSNASAFVNASLVGGQQARYTYGNVTFTRDSQYFIQGPSTSYGWGYNQIETADMKQYFVEGTYDADFDPSETIYAMKAKLSFTADVTFDWDSNTISLSNFAITSSYYIYEDGDGDGNNYASIKTGEVVGSTVTFANVSLNSGGNWYIACDGSGRHAGMANMPANVTMLGTSATTSTYFYRSTTTGDANIATGWGGTYTIVCNGVTGAITSVTCTALKNSDMIIVHSRTNGQSQTALRTSSFDSVSSNVWTCSTATHLYLGESLYLKNDNTTTVYGGASATHEYKTNNGLTITYASDLAKYFKTENNMLKARVDVSVKFTFTLDKANANGTLHVTHATENTNITFNHARTAGIYIEFANNSSFNNSDFILMHTTSGVDAGGNPYKAQEAPVYTDASTTYMRIVETHSNGSNTTPVGESAIRAATESYYYTQVSPHSGFTDNTGYIAVAVSGAFTISLQKNNLIKIENFSGASSSSVEHPVPYYLIGRGMPGSELRDNDFTIPGGEQLYTYGGNSSTVPCYVGEYGENTDPETYLGTGIALKKGDTFALSSTGGLLTTFAATSASVSINNTTHIVTVNKSATYRIYLTGSVGAETIHIEEGSAGSEWTRNGSQVGGFTLIESSGSSLTFGGNLDISLLDAYGNEGYSFVVELSHDSTVSGTMTYSLTNSNAFAITADKSDNGYTDSLSYTDATSISASTKDSTLTRAITPGTNKTCIRITLSPATIKAMLASGTYSFSLTIACQFTEGTIS